MNQLIGQPRIAGANPPVEADLRERTTFDLVIAGLALSLLVAFGPSMAYPSWTPRLALVLGAAPAALVALILLARSGNLAARTACVSAGWILVAALASSAPRSALIGFAGRDLSALVVISCLGLWSLATSLTEAGRRLFRLALYAGLLFNLVIGLLQLAFDVRSGLFAMNGGRPSGLMTNPVYFGGVMAGGVGVACRQSLYAAAQQGMHVSLLIVFGCSIGVSLSGSRVAVIAVVVVLGVAVGMVARPGLRAVAWSAAGLLLGLGLQRVFGPGRDVVTRATDGGGLDGRLEAWQYAGRAVIERPVQGWGFGRFQAAVQGHYSPEFVVRYARQDIGQAWFDAHNVVIGVAVAVGIVGLFLLTAFVVTAVRSSDGELLWFVGAVAVTWLLQPPSLATLPIVALALGASSKQVERTLTFRGGYLAVVRRISVVLGLALLTYLLVADVALYRVTESLDGEHSETAARLFPGDPVVADLVAQVWAIEAGDEADRRAIEWQQTAAHRDESRPFWWTELAKRQLAANDLAAADRALDRALDLQPYHYSALRLRVVSAARARDLDLLRSAIDGACLVEAPECDLDPVTLLDDLDHDTSGQRRGSSES